MPEPSTWSFTDVNAVISHPSKGQYIVNGVGVGSISIEPATSNTLHDRAADGKIMVSKIAADDGTVALEMQQTSPLNKWLLGLYNYLRTADASEWARASVSITDLNTNSTSTCTGVSPDKRASKPFKAQGQMVTWTLMAASIIDE